MTHVLTFPGGAPAPAKPAASTADQRRARFARRIRRLALRCRARCGGEQERERSCDLAAKVPSGGVGVAMRAHRLLCRQAIRDLRDCGCTDCDHTARLIDLVGDYIQGHGYRHWRGEWLLTDQR